MMNSRLAGRISQHLNKPDIIATINEYIHERVSILQRFLVDAKDPVEIYRIQGSITELQRMLKLRDDALAVLDRQRQDERIPDG